MSQAKRLIPEIPAGSDIVYWRTTHCLANDRKTRPELDEVATLFFEAAISGLGQLYQRRHRTDSRPLWARQYEQASETFSNDERMGIVIDYCFRKLD